MFVRSKQLENMHFLQLFALFPTFHAFRTFESWDKISSIYGFIFISHISQQSTSTQPNNSTKQHKFGFHPEAWMQSLTIRENSKFVLFDWVVWLSWSWLLRNVRNEYKAINTINLVSRLKCFQGSRLFTLFAHACKFKIKINCIASNTSKFNNTEI